MIKITCTSKEREKMIKDSGFPSPRIADCKKLIGCTMDDCLCTGLSTDCEVCKAQNIEWEIVEDEKKEEKKKDSPKFTVREIAEMLRDCNETPCDECPLDDFGNCRVGAGRMILDQLESSEDVPPITKEDAIYLWNKRAEPERTAKVVVHEGFVHICDIALPVTEHLCDACKKKVIIGDDYCSHCGAKLEWE